MIVIYLISDTSFLRYYFRVMNGSCDVKDCNKLSNSTITHSVALILYSTTVLQYKSPTTK